MCACVQDIHWRQWSVRVYLHDIQRESNIFSSCGLQKENQAERSLASALKGDFHKHTQMKDEQIKLLERIKFNRFIPRPDIFSSVSVTRGSLTR